MIRVIYERYELDQITTYLQSYERIEKKGVLTILLNIIKLNI
jgi:hypothetical protein